MHVSNVDMGIVGKGRESSGEMFAGLQLQKVEKIDNGARNNGLQKGVLVYHVETIISSH